MAWIKTLPDNELNNLINGLCVEAVVQPALYGRLTDEWWKRNSVPAHVWPVVDRVTHEPLSDLRYTRFCHKAKSPSDPEHKPVRSATQKHPEIPRTWYACSCGIRDGDERYQFQIDKLWRTPETLWWPSKVREGTLCYGVCPHASAINDPAHAPLWYEEVWDGADPRYVRCTCRHLYAILPLDDDEYRDIGLATWVPVE